MANTDSRIVITGIGLTAPNGNSVSELRKSLLNGSPRMQRIPMRYMEPVIAGVCDFDGLRYQSRKEVRRGTRAGSIAIFCAHEAIASCGIDWEAQDKSRVGVYLGITEHGNVETENEVYSISKFDYDVRYWTHHHNPRTVSNNPAGEVTISLGITGPHYTIGAACAAGNAGMIQGLQMLRLGEVDFAVTGGVSESIHTFGIFAGFKSQGALADHEDPNLASRPFDKSRSGIVVSEGGCVFILERLEEAMAREAPIMGEIVGYAMNSDAKDEVLPDAVRQSECISSALDSAGLKTDEVDIVSTHATATEQGDIQECEAIRRVFHECPDTYFNNTKSFVGHAMGAAGAIELAGNIPSFEDGMVHPTINIDELDPRCEIPNLVIGEPVSVGRIDTILNNSFGMLGINSCLIIKRFTD